MGKFVGGIVFALVVIGVGLFASLKYGVINLRADAEIPRWEQDLAEDAAEAYIDRHAPKLQNPVPVNDATLRDGARLYNRNCALCHGGPANPISQIADGFYPRVPQFLKQAPDLPEYKNFFIIKYGVRWTGMPGWSKVLSDEEMWKVAAFVTRMEKLPPAVDTEWRKMP